MPLGLYSEQMGHDGQRELHCLYEKAALKIHLPMEDISEEQLRNSEQLRIERYERLASFMAARSQALIALWDGLDSESKGGTAEVVSRRLKRFEEPTQPEEGTFKKACTTLSLRD